jgi:translation initiation factor IF-3
MNINNRELSVNEGIRDREVRVIDANGDQLGIMSPRKAMEIAEQRQLDLVKVAPQAKPPVCRIMDYGKYRFEMAKKGKRSP